MLEVRRLRLLHELSRRGTIAAVAEALHFSPSAVSQQLALLEAEAGVDLIEHVGRGVRLTEAGARLALGAGAVLVELERAEADLAAAGGTPAGTVRIASFQTVIRALLPRALHRLKQHERLRVEVVQVEPERGLPALLAHDFDLMVGEEYPGAPAPVVAGLHRSELCRDPLRAAASDLAGRFSLKRLADRAWVMEPAGSAARAWATATCRAAGFEPDVRYETDDLLTHVELVAHGHAAALLPDLVWSGAPPRVPVYPLRGRHRRIFTLVREAGGAHPAVRAVRVALHEAAIQPVEYSSG